MADDRQLRKEYFKAQSGQNTGMSYHEWLENEIYKLRTEVLNKNDLLQLVRHNGVPFNMQDLMLYYSDSDFVFNSPLTDVIKGMLNDA